MPLSEMHRQVAAIALQAAAGHGFALGGGNALIQHGVISRPTQDVDLFTDQEAGVLAAATSVESALREAGFGAERQDLTAGLAGIFPGMSEGLAEWIITAPDGEQMALQLAYFDRSREPVLMEVGPVLDLEDVVGGKVWSARWLAEPMSVITWTPPRPWRATARLS
jgi:Nucleotidyl transferase AbiEii toxin, Type IV TA system